MTEGLDWIAVLGNNLLARYDVETIGELGGVLFIYERLELRLRTEELQFRLGESLEKSDAGRNDRAGT